MRRLPTVFVLLVAFMLPTLPVRSYTLQYTDSVNKTQIRWPGNRISLTFSTSLYNPPANVKAGSDVVGALRRALASWSDAADIEFVESWSKEQSISAIGNRGDGVSLITIADSPENIAPFAGPSSEMSGRTRVFFSKTGLITEADIVLNPYQLFSTDGSSGTYDLESTFAHEIGHLLGLEHSSIVGATMQPRQGRNGIYGLPTFGPRSLSQDDIAGARAIYGVRPDDALARGTVIGTISYRDGSPVFGASVWAEESTTGRLVASSITLANGSYQIDNLLPGKYDIRVEALDGAVLASEIASQRGAYASLAAAQLAPFRTEELGLINIFPDRTARLNGLVSESPTQINATLVGFNGQLSTLAVPLLPGRTYTVFVGGEELNLKQIAGVSVTSHYINVDPASIVQQQYGDNLSVISFDVVISEHVPDGDYSLRFQSQSGEVAYIAGCLSVDKNAAASTQ